MIKRVVALAGRPNTGKTTLFNALTGLRQRTANFAGCTVEKAFGALALDGGEIEAVDLPGTHSLLPATLDEQVAFRFLSESAESGDDLRVLCVAEASNLLNDVALAAGLRAAGYPVVLAVNMIDEARLNGIGVNTEALSEALGMPVAAVSARAGEGLDRLRELLSPRPLSSDLSGALDWRRAPRERLVELQARAVSAAEQACAAGVTLPPRALLPTVERSIRMDRVLLHAAAGPIILAAALFLLFQALFVGARPLMDGLSTLFAAASQGLRPFLPAGPAGLVCDGVIPGVAAVLVFVPQIAILFLMIGALEQSGYLPRAGAMVDRALRPFGLDGKVFIPFLSGFACAIPGVMAARTIASEKRRLVAVLLTPLMTCSARLPVYTLIIAAFVPASFQPWGLNGQGLVMAGLYAFGVLMALLLAFALKWTRLHEDHLSPATVLPPYRMPRAGELARYVWTRVWHFLSRVGRVIFAVSVALWLLAAYPRNEAALAPLRAKIAAAEASRAPGSATTLQELRHEEAAAQIKGSLLGRAGRVIEPVFRPLGWDWRVSVGVLSSLAAREVFVGTLGTLYAMGREAGASESLGRALREARKPDGSPRYTLATAIGLLVFFALALQCVSTIAIVRRETGGWKWPAIQFTGFFILAYSLSFAAVRLAAFFGA